MLTDRQKQVLDFLKRYEEENGFYPTLDEISTELGLASPSAAHRHVKELERLGYLRREQNRPRGMVVCETPELVRVPVKGRIAAGKPFDPTEENEESIAVPRDVLPRSGEFFGLRVIGESMIEDDINNGDIIIVRPDPSPEDGDKVVALINNDSATLKRFYHAGSMVELRPANAAMRSFLVKPSDLDIQGKVVCVVKSPKTTLEA
jgi:SOS regulatory protein LexA